MSLREEFRSICAGFNETYGHALYRAEIAGFDTLPFDKYEALLKKAPASRTWLLSVDLRSNRAQERLIFYFRHISVMFISTARKQKKEKQLPPAEVTLAISRSVSGTSQPLRVEPIKVREIAYSDGVWRWLIVQPNGLFSVEEGAVSVCLNSFLKDAFAAFF